MSFVSRVNQMDLWVLDRVFQPIADRLPEKWPPFEVGMSFQLGALLFYATSVILIMVVNGLGLASAFFDVLSWAVGLALFVGIMRMRVLVRPGHANPLRIMLQGLRPLSIAFALFSLWRGAGPGQISDLAWCFIVLSDVAFSVGLYFISCLQNPPQVKISEKVILLRPTR